MPDDYQKQLQAEMRKEAAAAKTKTAQARSLNAQLGKLGDTQLGKAGIPALYQWNQYKPAVSYNPNASANIGQAAMQKTDASAQIGKPPIFQNAQLGYKNLLEAQLNNMYKGADGGTPTGNIFAQPAVPSIYADQLAAYYRNANPMTPPPPEDTTSNWLTEEEIQALMAAGIDPDMIRGVSPANRLMQQYGPADSYPTIPELPGLPGGQSQVPGIGSQYQFPTFKLPEYYGGGYAGYSGYSNPGDVSNWSQRLLQWNINRPKGN